MKELIPICPNCGGEIIEKKVEKIVKGGCNTAIITIEAGTCTKCGERYYTKETHEKMQKIRKELEKGATIEFHIIGHTYAYNEALA
jgi:YgiT-type zinc finger domain-containing protein